MYDTMESHESVATMLLGSHTNVFLFITRLKICFYCHQLEPQEDFQHELQRVLKRLHTFNKLLTTVRTETSQ